MKDETSKYEKKQKYSAAEIALVARLPSVRAINSFGGSTMARKKLSEQRKADTAGSNDEVINMTDLHDMPARSHSNRLHDNGTLTLSAAEPDFLHDLTYKDLDMLKELKCPMWKKKQLRAKAIAEHGKRAGRSKWSGNTSESWHHFKEDSIDVLRRLQLWRESIHQVEGQFGSGVRSYFAFLRWLFLLNMYIFFLVFIFTVIPTIIFENIRTPSISSANNVSAECQYNPYDPNSIHPFSQYIIWWFTGQGFMENTLLFYGYYENVVQIITVSFYYNIPLAYLLVGFFYFLLSLVLIVRRAAAGLKESLVVDKDRFYTYCNKLFGGWDFCITSENTAKLKHKSIKYELQTDLKAEQFRAMQASRSRKDKIILYTKRALINIVVVAVLVAAMVAIFFAARYALENTSTFNDNFFLDLIVTYLTSIVITLANFIAPFIFEFLIEYEGYSPAFAIKFTLTRTVFLRLASVVFLYVVVYLQVNCNRYPVVDTIYNVNCSYCEGVQCWETYLGQEMYKLTIFDFFVNIAVILLVEFPRRLIVEHCSCGFSRWLDYQEFSIPTNVLDIVYAQTVGWIGAFYAPLLPAMLVIKFFVFFYLKKLTLIYNCRPATRPYRASKSGTFFFIILLFGFVVAAFPVVISVSIMTPSQDCGPFRGWSSMFYAMTAAILQLPNWLQQAFGFIASSAFAAVIIIILCLVVYYFYAVSSAHQRMISLLKDQLTLEGKDKQFLLSRVNKLNEELQNNGLQRPLKDARRRSLQGNKNRAYSPDSDHSSIPGQIEE